MNDLPLLYNNRPEEEKDFIKLVCNDILSKPIEEKEYSEDFAFIFVDGRKDTNFETLENKAMFHSCKAFSKKKYPIFCFVNNVFGLKNAAIDELTIIPIDEINSLEKYSDFCIKELYFKLPANIENIITIQADGMLLKNGWEDYVISSKCDWLSSHWKHNAIIEAFLPELHLLKNGEPRWKPIINPTPMGNGGFSFRKVSIMKQISNIFSTRLKLREYGRADDRFPMEDLFFGGLMTLFKDFKMPTLKQADGFSKDPLTLKDWNNKTYGFGFHYFKTVSEFPECNHE